MESQAQHTRTETHWAVNLPTPPPRSETLGGNAPWTVGQQGNSFVHLHLTERVGLGLRCHTHGAVRHVPEGRDAAWECGQLPPDPEVEVTVPHLVRHRRICNKAKAVVLAFFQLGCSKKLNP